MSRKTVSKSPADGLVELAILNVYMRRINYDSATVNISFLFGQRNISLRNDISFTTNHEIGSLAVRKVEKSRES